MTAADSVTWYRDGGDVWAWEVPVSGQSTADIVAIRVHGRDYEVDRAGRAFSATVPLRSGENRVEALAERAEGLVTVGEILFTVPLPPAPRAHVQMRIDNDRIVLDSTSSVANPSTGAPIIARHWSVRSGNPAPLVVGGETWPDAEVDGPALRVTVPSGDGEYYVSVRVVDEAGEQDTSTGYFIVEDGRPRVPDVVNESAAWIDGAVVYGVLPPMFGTPPLESVARRLDYLRSLGVTALWLSPLTTTVPHSAGYGVIDYFTVRDDFGTAEDLRELVDQAHARGIRVLMDFVPNHTSDEHRYYLDAERNGQRSLYWEMYDRDVDGRATHYFEWVHLPNLNFGNAGVQRFVTEAMSYWIREFDIDGYRVDAAWGVKLRCPEFWPELRAELARIKPDLLLLAEASARDHYYGRHGFDAAYDWTDRLGEWAWHDVWSPPDGIVDRLHLTLTDRRGEHPDGARVFRFLNNNDTGRRFVTAHGAGLAKVAAAMLFTIDGIPTIYTGDEFGAQFHPYDDHDALDWDHDPHLLRPYYRRLVELRRELTSLTSGRVERVRVEPARCVYAYIRSGEADPPVLCLQNYGDEDVVAELALPEQLRTVDHLTDRLHEGAFAARNGTLTVDLPAYTARILTP